MTAHITRNRLFWAFVAVQLVFLSGLVAMKERALTSGTTVILQTRPVDPVDLVRGNYVTLSYDISTVQTDADVQEGDTVYVALSGGPGRLNSASTAYESSRDIPGEDALFIKGTVESRSDRSLSVSYADIETYYAPTEQAQEIERELADGAQALVALSEDGSPSLCSIEGASNWRASMRCPGSF